MSFTDDQLDRYARHIILKTGGRRRSAKIDARKKYWW